MGEYKVPQDVEAEDKILGPLTLRQFIFVVVGLGWGALSFAILRKLPALFIAFGVPPTILFLLLGVYKRQDQPFEALFLALLSFFKNPRKRLWEKEPIEEVFKIEPAPPKTEPIVRDPRVVKGQLEKLVHAMESAEGSTKRPELQEPGNEVKIDNEDRIFVPKSETEPRTDVGAEVSNRDDVLDAKNNARAHDIGELIEGAAAKVREHALSQMHHTRGVKAKTKNKPAGPPPKITGHTNTHRTDSVSEMTPTPATDILKQSLADSNLRVNQIAERVNQPAGALTEGQTVKVDGKKA